MYDQDLFARRRLDAIHHVVPSRADGRQVLQLCFDNIMEMLFAPNEEIVTSFRQVLLQSDDVSEEWSSGGEDVISMLIESHWNAGVVYLLHCLHATQPTTPRGTGCSRIDSMIQCDGILFMSYSYVMP
jgi:hypothetical protein